MEKLLGSQTHKITFQTGVNIVFGSHYTCLPMRRLAHYWWGGPSKYEKWNFAKFQHFYTKEPKKMGRHGPPWPPQFRPPCTTVPWDWNFSDCYKLIKEFLEIRTFFKVINSSVQCSTRLATHAGSSWTGPSDFEIYWAIFLFKLLWTLLCKFYNCLLLFW